MSYKRTRATLLALSAGLLLGLLQAGASQAGTLPTANVAVTPSAATITGALESGAVNVAISDTGVKEAAVLLLQLKPGATVAEVEALLATKQGSDPNSASIVGSIGFDAEANPGAPTEAATVLSPGEYVLLVGEGEKPVKVREHFTVKASKAPAALPAPAATERTIEFGFKGPATLHDGELVAFENEGFLVHMDVAFPVRNAKAARAAVKDLLAGRQKALEKLIAGPPVGFAGPVSHGALQEETISAKPGIYVQACFMQTQDGRDHTMLGMERIIRIAK